ncbi:hypothetical protein Ccrd_020611 [Cynara cardunculus var. scolymus]|uniref:Uncharacterized protein n=1 Tax=Cynara cardunculus var. scolymus TaxID=59895 RepID=A0A103Y250_CYNCS|nr:hypothetical protein Ccrd_020611 [Cynara cardunculus var. scolymus]
MRYDKNCPPVRSKPLVLTRAPLIRAGEASKIYNGDVMETIPTPKPTKILPTIMTHGFRTRAMTNDPVMNKISANNIDFFLPNLSFIHPPKAPPMIAPATAMLTMVTLREEIQSACEYRPFEKCDYIVRTSNETCCKFSRNR